jgi:hypothetical protein
VSPLSSPSQTFDPTASTLGSAVSGMPLDSDEEATQVSLSALPSAQAPGAGVPAGPVSSLRTAAPARERLKSLSVDGIGKL